jgi:hypothetical protein
MTVKELKTRFSELIEWLKLKEKIAATFGKKKSAMEYFVPEMPGATGNRNVGILQGRASVDFHTDFKISGEEFLGL